MAHIISHLSLTPGTRLGVYDVTAQLGEGGMGQVFLASDTKLKRQVAIKILPPALAADAERFARFQRDAEVLASLNHPNIAPVDVNPANVWSRQSVIRSGPLPRSAARFHTLAALVVACGLMAMLCLVAAAQSPQKTVLVLIPLQRGSSMSLDIGDTIRTVLNDGLAGQLDYYTEYLDVARFPEPDYQPAVRDFFRRKYARQTFDMVIATTDVTLEFVNAYRDELFPTAAVVSGVSSPQANLSTPRAGPRATGVVFPVDLKRTIDVAIQLQPDLRDVFVVSGASDTDRGYQDLARAQFRAFDGRIRFTYSSGLAIQDLLRRVSALPQHTIVYFLTFFDDGHHSKFDGLAALDQVAAVANVPTYVWIDTRMGHGSVGGSVFSVERAAGALANVALRVLKGESPESIPVREIDAHITQFDWRQLRRFGISETRLPAGSLVRFREPSLWDQVQTLHCRRDRSAPVADEPDCRVAGSACPTPTGRRRPARERRTVPPDGGYGSGAGLAVGR